MPLFYQNFIMLLMYYTLEDESLSILLVKFSFHLKIYKVKQMTFQPMTCMYNGKW